MFNKEKFKYSLRKIALAIAFAFTGPIVFVWNSGQNEDSILNNILSFLGFVIMLGALFFGFKGIKQILAAFFDPPNE